MQVRSQLRSILTRIGTGVPFADSDDVFDRGVVRSLDMIEMITAIEDTFGVEVAQRDVFEGHLRSIDRLVSFLASRSS